MTKIGEFTSSDEVNPSSLEKNAYHPRFRGARRLYAGIGALVATGTLLGAGYTADIMDNGLACSGEGRTVTLSSGGKLSDLVDSVPHINTPPRNVMQAIANMNDARVGWNYDTDSFDLDNAAVGTYRLPEECNSRFAMPSVRDIFPS